MQTNKGENLIVQLSFSFSIDSIRYCEYLNDEKKFSISNQLLRSSTSIGACVREAQNAESRMDFIHKMKIAAKEADETHYWLQLCNELNYGDCLKLIESCVSIIKILSKIIGSTKRNIIS